MAESAPVTQFVGQKRNNKVADKRIQFTLDDGTQGSMTEEEARRLNIRAYQSKNDAKTSANHRTSMIVEGGGHGKLKKTAKMKRATSKKVKTIYGD